MPLQHAYGLWSWDGEPVTHDELVARRDRQIAVWEAELRDLAVEFLGQDDAKAAVEFPLPAINRFAARFLARANAMVMAAYITAAGGVEAIADRGWQRLAGLVQRQQDYGQRFIAAIKAGTLSPAQVAARSAMYPGAAVTAFSHGQADQLNLDLPIQPGEDCAGGSRCRCSWEIDQEENEYRCYWRARDDENTCGICAGHARLYNPYTIVGAS